MNQRLFLRVISVFTAFVHQTVVALFPEKPTQHLTTAINVIACLTTYIDFTRISTVWYQNTADPFNALNIIIVPSPPSTEIQKLLSSELFFISPLIGQIEKILYEPT